jgi:hypothetical protein
MDASSKGLGFREKIVRRAALELKDGMSVNLGIGIPTLASNVCILILCTLGTYFQMYLVLAQRSYCDASKRKRTFRNWSIP